MRTSCDIYVSKCDKHLKKWITKYGGITNRDGLQSDIALYCIYLPSIIKM